MSASAPDPPPLLFGTSGRLVRSFFSATDWMNRAIWSAPPPGPAMITKSIGFLGCQSWARAAIGVDAMRPAQARPRRPRLVIDILKSSSLLDARNGVRSRLRPRTHNRLNIFYYFFLCYLFQRWFVTPPTPGRRRPTPSARPGWVPPLLGVAGGGGGREVPAPSPSPGLPEGGGARGAGLGRLRLAAPPR